ncbi:ATP-dependent Clp protease adaptor ClpS [Luteibaculum oceani]|uniref:ATP-dependent Clp protease adaptor ClpS n=1 Tax=Luteibaculum oceani TaxID=1294296 RepID=A0A5C6UVI2_9FLAO|nr:ATP-dependent Clp protease adaptor ClpS [Luteibaculum oceani]TXC76979.1 ATP-dependent Clp protease adaptor ClpS [Luteibaculum oceani]
MAGVKEQEYSEVDVLLEEQKEHQLILFNDDVNTFDHVIDCLVDVCKHDPIQAEQCAYIVHYRGKCVVKEGELEEMVQMCTSLLNRDLSAEVN